MQRTMSGRGRAEPAPQRAREVGQVVERAAAQRRAVVRRRVDADDLDAVPPLVVRVVLVPEQPARDDRHVVLVRERLAELGQQLRGRLDPGPVVLVEDEQALAALPGQDA